MDVRSQVYMWRTLVTYLNNDDLQRNLSKGTNAYSSARYRETAGTRLS